MALYNNKTLIEAGVDEVARGCLAGPVYAAAVIWPNDIDYLDPNIILKDSKKLNKKKRNEMRDYIEEYAIDYSVTKLDNTVIDKMNILNATYKCMHNSLDKLNVLLDHVIVDGDKFKMYTDTTNTSIPHTCVIKGDSKFVPVAAASILAKVYHDQYIEKLCDENEELNVYDWKNNMCYGTKKHIDAIKKHGITKYHRKTFGICNIYGE